MFDVSCLLFFFFKQKTAYEMRISDWSSDVCSSDLQVSAADAPVAARAPPPTPFTRVLGEIGDAVVVSLTTLYGLLGFLGATTIAFWNVLRDPRRFRFNATVHRFEVVGVSALGIIGLMSFLIGIDRQSVV